MTQLGIIIRQTFKFTKDLPLSNSIIFSLGFMQPQVFIILYPKRKLIINSHFLAFIVGMYKTEQNRKHYLRLCHSSSCKPHREPLHHFPHGLGGQMMP